MLTEKLLSCQSLTLAVCTDASDLFARIPVAETGREMQGVPDQSFAALMDRLRRKKAPRLAIVMLKYLQRTGPTPAAEVKEFLNISDRSVSRYENALLEADGKHVP
jgi:hypothetical protein